MRKILTVTVALAILSIMVAISPTAAAEDLTATRSLSGDLCPGSTVTVTIDLTVAGSNVEGLAITEDLSDIPADWTVTVQDGGNYISTTKKVEYVWFDSEGNLGDKTVTYEISIPGDATIGESHDITGLADMTVSGGTTTTVNIGTDTITVVDCGNNGQASLSADRTLSGSMCPGSTVTVTVDLTVTGSNVEGLAITEDLSDIPADWTVTALDGGNYISTTKKVEYVWYDQGGNLGDKTVTYEISIPGDATIGESHDITGLADMTVSGGTTTTVNIGTDTITVVECEPEVEGIKLYEGWNLFSVPCVLDDDSRAHVLEGVDYEAIIWFDASSQQWEDNPATIEPLTAYAIQVNNTTQQVITNIECTDLPIVPPSRHMYPGWNLVGLTSYDTKTAESAFIAGGIDDSYSRVWGPWNAGDRVLEQLVYNRNFLDPGAGYLYTEDYIMWPYKGQWIFMEQEDTLIAIGP